MSANSYVNQALQGWVDLIGMTEEGKIQKETSWSPYVLEQHTKLLNESRLLDPSGLTTFMMLRGLVERYLRDVRFDAFSIVLDPKSIETQIAPMRHLRNILEAPEIVDLIAGFQNRIRKAAEQYGVRPGEPTDALENLLSDRYDLAYVRKDALSSIEELEAHQFTQGDPDPKPLKFNPQIYEFWNINSLLAAMRGQKVAGISMCLIRDPEEALHSYFVFAIRNGGTLTILTDRGKAPHPGYNRMTRRPDRTLDARAARHWFPYHLLKLNQHLDPTGEVKRISVEARKQLVPINVEAVALADIRDLRAEEFVWTTLMFDLISERYWKENRRLSEVSYTGQMVQEPQALIGHASALVKDGLYKPLELPLLKREDVTAETTAEQWDTPPTRFNQWMVKRYGHHVREEVLNLVGEEQKQLLQGKSIELATVSKALAFETLSPMTFGSKEDVQRDRLWVARVNQMAVIQAHAEKEYEELHEEVLAWYKEAIRKNKEFILNACAKGTLSLPRWHPRTMLGPSESDLDPWQREEDSIEVEESLDQKVGKSPDWFWDRPSVVFGEHVHSRYLCCEGGGPGTIFSKISPTCPHAIAILCGVKVEELPWPLQHWYHESPYYGNSILTRLDPEDWKLHNPWMPDRGVNGLRLGIGVSHSKSALHARRKALGLPRKEYKSDE